MIDTDNRYQYNAVDFRLIVLLIMENCRSRVGVRMKMVRQVAVKGLLFVMIAVLLLAGCSNNNAGTENENQGPAANSGTAVNETNDSGNAAENERDTSAEQDIAAQFPITIKHAFGETVIESKPERVVTIAWANHDVALALGVVPVGFSAANYGVQDDSGLLPWTKKKLEELGVTNPNVFQDTAGLDFEAISDADPDVILAAYSGITQEEYDTLSEIAPVVAYPEQPWVITWREQVRMNAAGMGMIAEGEQLIKDIEQLLADKVAQYPELKGVKAVFAFFSPSDLSSFYVYTPGDPRGEFLLELGMEFPDSAQQYVASDSEFALNLSAENADALNGADIIIAYGDDALLHALQADPVFGKVPAVQRGSMVLIPDNTPLAASGNPNPLSIEYTTDEYLSLIVEAVRKINK
jgi:iron complex transport system substrate-binding protein